MWKYLECSTPCVEAHFAFPDPLGTQNCIRIYSQLETQST